MDIEKNDNNRFVSHLNEQTYIIVKDYIGPKLNNISYSIENVYILYII